jgi:hypothetical protein
MNEKALRGRCGDELHAMAQPNSDQIMGLYG